MRLENEFTVPAPPAQAWPVLLDVERVAPCLPGAALDGRDGTQWTGTMTIKLGPVTSRYRGTVRIEERDEPAGRAVLRAQARDARGDGTAAATITTRLTAAGEGTRVLVSTDLTVSGPAAQFGRGVMQEVSGKLMRQFAEALAEEMGAGTADGMSATDDVAPLTGVAGPVQPTVGASALAYEDTRVGRLPLGPAGDAAEAAAAPSATATAPRAPRTRRSAEVLDLGAASRGAIAKRAVPAAIGLAAVAAAAGLWRQRRAAAATAPWWRRWGRR